jgi:hypothetical protein
LWISFKTLQLYLHSNATSALSDTAPLFLLFLGSFFPSKIYGSLPPPNTHFPSTLAYFILVSAVACLLGLDKVTVRGIVAAAIILEIVIHLLLILNVLLLLFFIFLLLIFFLVIVIIIVILNQFACLACYLGETLLLICIYFIVVDLYFFLYLYT